MASPSKHLAIDLGAESGRAVVGTLRDGRLAMEEIHRFPNRMLPVRGRLHWDVYRLYEHILEALAMAPDDVESIGIDTWGVDFGVLDRNGMLMGLPFAYRDERNPRAMESFFRRFPRQRVYELTGTEILPFNSLFQMEALRLEGSVWLEAGSRVVFLPELLSHLLTGVAKTEFTFASTSQLYDTRTRSWVGELVEAVGLQPGMLGEVVPSGTPLGPLSDDVCRSIGGKLFGVPVVAVASHDTASAVAAAPAEGDGWGFISSGTWSIMGVETPAAVVTEATYRAGFTNEGSASGGNLLMKNVMGLWLIQRLRARLPEPRPSYADLAAWAAAAEPFQAMVDPDRPAFLNPEDMAQAAREECEATGQRWPSDTGSQVRVLLESLAFKYRWIADKLQEAGVVRPRLLHVIGGGSQNALLCQMTADAVGVPVIAGPSEATAAGNLLTQALAMGRLSGWQEVREVMRVSSGLTRYDPVAKSDWDRRWPGFVELVEGR
ncbi:MAG: rhamnulokinase [Fimbriimonadales bacterium]|nr:rhamnulokinase [Fimbriimonadales bacterium]